MQKSGYVAIIGRPNVGKSTLMNALVGQKISIMTAKPQTTRLPILGIKVIGDTQIIYVDTPGVHKDQKRVMSRYLNRLAAAAMFDADVIIFMIEALCWHDEDQLVLDKLHQAKSPVLLVINKVDTVKDKNLLLPFIEKMNSKFAFANIIPLSALRVDAIEELESIIAKFLPEHPFLFPADQITDKSERFQIAECIREKLIRLTGQEVPYCLSVEVESLVVEEKQVNLNVIIWVEREGQKIIVIGHKGERLKKVGTQARLEIEKLLGKKVFLRLWVKVKSNWTDNERALRSLGYE